jgi:hypothetical protein
MDRWRSAGADGPRWIVALAVGACVIAFPTSATAQVDVGSVSGRVVDGQGNPLAGINVSVNAYDGAGPSTGTQTDADGTYHTDPLPADDYRVQFDDPTDAFANQYWDGHAAWNDADRLHLEGSDRTDIDATLSIAATISGVVTDDTSTPLAAVCVYANTPASNGGWSGVGGSTTDADGTYTLTGLPPSIELRIQFQDCAATKSHVDQWYKGAADFNAATPLNLTPGEAVSDINADLATGVAVSGTVRGDSGPLGGINVYVNPYDGPGPSTGAQTDADGNYRTGALPDGDYRVQFDDQSNVYADQYWNGRAGWNDDRLTLDVGNGPDHGDINATLTRAATITGTVTDDTGPVAGICVNANTPSSNGGWSGVGQARKAQTAPTP